MKETMIIPMVVALEVTRAIMAEEEEVDEEYAEDTEEAEEVAAEEAETIVSI
jgi:hypothetical protein